MAFDSDFRLTSSLQRHWRRSIVVVMLCLGAAGLVFLLAPRRYESDMKLLVKNERADLVISPAKSSADTERTDLNETEVNSEMELLHSRDILEAVAKNAKLYQPFQKDKAAAPTPTSLQKAVIKLGKDLNVSSIHKTNIIAVTYRSADPDQAAGVLRDLGERYLNAHLAVHSTPGTYKFFADEASKFKGKVSEAEAALSNFHRETQIFSMPQQTSVLVSRLEDARGQLQEIDAQIQEESRRQTVNRSELAGNPERQVTQVKGVPNPMAVQQLKTILTDLQNRRISLGVKFKPTERAIVDLDQEIRNTQRALTESENAELPERTTDVNPIYQSIKADLVKSNVSLAALQTRRGQVARMIQTDVGRLEGMDRNASTLQYLEESEKEAEENFLLYSRRVEEARLAESLDQQKFANVAVIETPVSSPIPVTPKLGLTLAIGAVFGIVLALALALMDVSKHGTELSPRSSNEFGRREIFSAGVGD